MEATKIQLFPEKFQNFIKLYELQPIIANKLFEILSTCEITIICDDSGSMKRTVVEYGKTNDNNKLITRWSKLKRLVAELLRITTTVQNGVDVYFLNEGIVNGVTDSNQLKLIFAKTPDGIKPLITSINNVIGDKKGSQKGKKLLVVIISDGEPSDNKYGEEINQHFFDTLVSVTNSGDVYISVAECTDDEEFMNYLDKWNGKIKNYDSTEDYREEIRSARRIMGPNFKFSYIDYVIKILLAPFVTSFDQKLDQYPAYFGKMKKNKNCCSII